MSKSARRFALRERGNDRRLWRAMVQAAQATYESHPEYGLSDDDMERAIRAALMKMEAIIGDKPKRA